MTEKYFLTVCSLGIRPTLIDCVEGLIQIKQISDKNVSVLLVINGTDLKHEFGPEVIVRFEPQKGYSNVRNRAIAELTENSSIIFIDDDELPTLSWFNNLVDMHEKHPLDLVFGPVFPESGMGASSYRNKFVSYFSKMADGALARQASTANLLIPASLLNLGLIRFDPLFNTSGSEDTDLSFRLRRRGIKIRFAKHALIYEVQQCERFESEYLESRFIKDISNYSLVIRRNSGLYLIVWRFFTLIVRVCVYFGLSLFLGKSRYKAIAYRRSLRALVFGKVSV
jgi:GT2 family glycosyltransferase